MGLYALLFVGTFIFMEFVAWFTHRYVMHGFLWSLHEDHHQGSPGFFEKNDAFFLIFAIPSFLCCLFGSVYGYTFLLPIGLGIMAYGLAYFLVHDIFIHQRFKLFRNTRNRYLLALRRAHKMHHKHLNPSPGELFGMLSVARKYFPKPTDSQSPASQKTAQ